MQSSTWSLCVHSLHIDACQGEEVFFFRTSFSSAICLVCWLLYVPIQYVCISLSSLLSTFCDLLLSHSLGPQRLTLAGLLDKARRSNSNVRKLSDPQPADTARLPSVGMIAVILRASGQPSLRPAFLWSEESAWALELLDVDKCKERFNVNTRRGIRKKLTPLRFVFPKQWDVL